MTSHLDGNVLAGALSELTGTDPTDTMSRCLGCHDVAPLAAELVFGNPDAWVVRCRHCDDVLLVVVHHDTTTVVTLDGVCWWTELG
jgi:hypothetical protein